MQEPQRWSRLRGREAKVRRIHRKGNFARAAIAIAAIAVVAAAGRCSRGGDEDDGKGASLLVVEPNRRRDRIVLEAPRRRWAHQSRQRPRRRRRRRNRCRATVLAGLFPWPPRSARGALRRSSSGGLGGLPALAPLAAASALALLVSPAGASSSRPRVSFGQPNQPQAASIATLLLLRARDGEGQVAGRRPSAKAFLSTKRASARRPRKATLSWAVHQAS